jgi:hypothetical protein
MNRAMGSGVPCAACSATHFSSATTTRRMSRPVSPAAIPAISSKVTAALAVSVTGPSKDRWPARITAAASASSARSVQDTGPSAGVAMTPVSRQGPSSQPRLCA